MFPERAATEILRDKLPGCLYSLMRQPGGDVGITLMKLRYLRSSEPLVPVVIIVRPWLLVPSFGIVAEHLGICLQNMVQGMQAVSMLDFFSIC